MNAAERHDRIDLVRALAGALACSMAWYVELWFLLPASFADALVRGSVLDVPGFHARHQARIAWDAVRLREACEALA